MSNEKKDEYSISDEIDELKQVRILADKSILPPAFRDIKKNIDKRIKILENLVAEKEKRKEKIIRVGKGKQISKLTLARIRNAEKKKEDQLIKFKKTRRNRDY